MQIEMTQPQTIPIYPAFDKLLPIENFYQSIISNETLATLQQMPANSIDLILTSPPYFLDKEYEDDKTFMGYLSKQTQIIKECNRVLKPTGSIYWNVAQTVQENEILPLGAMFYSIFKNVGAVGNFYMKNWIIWHFEGGINCKNRLSGRYENLLWFVKNKENYTFNLDEIRIPSKWQQLGDKRCNPLGKNPTDFWVFEDETEKELAFLDTENSIYEIHRIANNNKKEKTNHPCQFPEKLVERVIKSATNQGDVVLDIFNGSGTTCKVANDLQRNWIGIDKEEKYCKVAKLKIENNLQKVVKNNKIYFTNLEETTEHLTLFERDEPLQSHHSGL